MESQGNPQSIEYIFIPKSNESPNAFIQDTVDKRVTAIVKQKQMSDLMDYEINKMNYFLYGIFKPEARIDSRSDVTIKSMMTAIEKRMKTRNIDQNDPETRNVVIAYYVYQKLLQNEKVQPGLKLGALDRILYPEKSENQPQPSSASASSSSGPIQTSPKGRGRGRGR